MATLKAGIVLVILTLATTGGIIVPNARGSGQLNIDTSEGFRSGDVQVEPWLGTWFTWVSFQGVQMIFLALHSQVYNSPILSFTAQSYNTTAGSRIFVGNLLLMMEVYNDSDGNGILDANPTVGTTELQYGIRMNSSVSFTPTPVTTMVEGNVVHYKWGIRYGGVDASMSSPFARPYPEVTPGAKVMIDYVSFSYDYSILQNTTTLKTSFSLGNITLTSSYPSNLTLKGLSLDLLYSTVVVSPLQYEVRAGSTVVNSTRPNSPAISLDSAQLKVGDAAAYQFLFNQSYTLFQGRPSSYQTRDVTAPLDTFTMDRFGSSWFAPLNTLFYYVGNSLPVIGNLPVQSDLNYNSSRFLYRVSYPIWSGYAIQHDPTYVAYFVPILTVLPLPTIAIVVSIGITALVASARGLRRLRKELGSSDSRFGPPIAGAVK